MSGREQASISGTIGSLWSRHLRDTVEKARFMGWSVDLWIGGGFLAREFIVRGDKGAVLPILEWLKEQE